MGFLEGFLVVCALVALRLDRGSANSQWILGEKHLPPDAYLVKSFGSKVQGGEYATYQLTSGGTLELVLKSSSGDADIYVSSKSKPVADDYEMSSVTCATDSVHISNDLPRPVHISIFGSPYYSVSEFTLDAYVVPPHVTYEDVYRSHESPSYERLAYEHVQLRDEHLTGARRDSDYGSSSSSSSSYSSSSSSSRSGRNDGGGGGSGSSSSTTVGDEQGWLEWFLDGDEGWVAVVTIVTGILKVILQILG